MHFPEPHSCSLIVAKERSLLKKKGAFFENLSYIQVHTHIHTRKKRGNASGWVECSGKFMSHYWRLSKNFSAPFDNFAFQL